MSTLKCIKCLFILFIGMSNNDVGSQQTLHLQAQLKIFDGSWKLQGESNGLIIDCIAIIVFTKDEI
jgi:hypothetical protein